MGLFEWFSKHESTHPHHDHAGYVEPLTFNEGERRLGGLDMKAALDAHAIWKQRLRQVFEGKLEVPEVSKVARDDLCLMGQWLHGEGKETFGKLDSYHDMVQAHLDFHLCVGEALSAHESGDREEAERYEKEVRRKSDRVQLSLVKLFVEVRDEEGTSHH